MTETIKAIAPEQTYLLRHKILRPNQSLEECAYPADEEPDSYHVGCFDQGNLVGVGSIYRESRTGTDQGDGWRIRGMAVLSERQGTGIGGKVMHALLKYAEQHTRQGEIWCNGRVTVKAFYELFGFLQEGVVFDLPPIGPHVVLVKKIETEKV